MLLQSKESHETILRQRLRRQRQHRLSRANASYRAAQRRAEHKPGKNIGARCFQIASTELQLSSAHRHGEFAALLCAKAELRVDLALLVVVAFAAAIAVAVLNVRLSHHQRTKSGQVKSVALYSVGAAAVAAATAAAAAACARALPPASVSIELN